jgi:flagellar motility protein MotE (MotC chaperone)
MQNNTETIELSKTSAWAALERLEEWLQYTDRLDAESRRDIAALDELIRVLDAEDWMTKQWYDRQAEHDRLMAEHKARQEEGKLSHEG